MADHNHNKLLSVLLLISSTLKLGQAECLAGQFLDSGSCVDCSAGYFNNATDATVRLKMVVRLRNLVIFEVFEVKFSAENRFFQVAQ